MTTRLGHAALGAAWVGAWSHVGWLVLAALGTSVALACWMEES